MKASALGRREFIGAIGAVAVACPSVARAQQRQVAMPVIGLLAGNSPSTFADDLMAVRQGLNDLGFVEHRNVGIEYRWAEDRYDRLPAMAADLVRQQVALIYAAPTVAVSAAKAATKTIPIVFTTAGDPVQLGLVASLNRPGGNLTGTTFYAGQLASKQLALLHELVPKAAAIGVIANPNAPTAEPQIRDLETAVKVLGLRLHVLHVSKEADIATAFTSLVTLRADALFVTADAFLRGRREPIVALAAHHRIPTMYAQRDFITAGGLISYTSSISEAVRLSGRYAGRILKGEKPADLPVMQPTRFELVVNLKIARMLGLNVPDRLLALADEVIE
jgi:putative ABC transport system substrate-binding protein